MTDEKFEFKYEADMSGLDNLEINTSEAIQRASRKLALHLSGKLAELSPVDHGRLQGSWREEPMGPIDWLVYSGVHYAMVVSEGSDPYTIYPKFTKALRFKVEGDFVFAKRVEHPGIEGTGYIPEAIERSEARISDFVRDAMEEVDL